MREMAGIKLYSVKELSEGLGINERTIRHWFHINRLKGVKLGAEWHITEQNLKKFLNAEKGGDEDRKKKKTRQLRALTKKMRMKGESDEGKYPKEG